jgi:hypothetical protein
MLGGSAIRCVRNIKYCNEFLGYAKIIPWNETWWHIRHIHYDVFVLFMNVYSDQLENFLQ